MAGLTPMMRQYTEIKEQYKDCILFFRLGDFYEMFFEDALTASKELEIALTGRDCGMKEKAPMCGVPHHAANNYITKLVEKGYKVAIGEQVEDVSQAKGIVKRDVVRVVTPGTLTDSCKLEEDKNNYLMAIYKDKYYSIAVVDITTGELYSTNVNIGNVKGKLIDEIYRYSPSEIIVNSTVYSDGELVGEVTKKLGAYIAPFDDENFTHRNAINKISDHFGECENIDDEDDLTINVSGALLKYLDDTQKVSLSHIRKINKYTIEEFVGIDSGSRRNLELTETMREKKKKGSLLSVLDKTVTSMGGRTMRDWVNKPLVNVSDINDRLNSVEEMKDKFMLRSEVREVLKGIYDVERLIGKIILGSVNCRDLIALKKSLGQLPLVKELSSSCEVGINKNNYEKLDILQDVYDLLEDSIQEEPPIAIKEGGIIKTGFNPELDKYRNASTEGKNWIADLEVLEREKTGIRNLKVGFNRIFGYYLEVTKSHYKLVPEHYTRKQTLANCERFIISELKEIEDTILGAEEKMVELEYKIFLEIKAKVAECTIRIKNSVSCIQELDVICALAEIADRESYVKPDVNQGGAIDIKDGRHPVVERMIGDDEFVPNDTVLDLKENRLSIITGPNMAGKSTYMRQVALIVLLAQMGSFVPASEAKIGVVDKIFTRVGASDDLASGQSTFMVEMAEVANILDNATKKSLLILDEIGRGTSTFDGLSIAWAVIEFISDIQKMGSRTLFATHYHELTELEGKIKGINNYCISVAEKGEDIIFLRKIIRGGADESYGIEVAKLAGVPSSVLIRAKEILKELEEADITKLERKISKSKKPINGQMDLFSFSKNKEDEEVVENIKNTDLTALTPIDALNMLYEFQKKLKKDS